MQSEHQSELTLTVPEVARLLRISRGSAYEAIRTGQLPSLRFGRTIRVPRVALEELLSKRARDTHSEEITVPNNTLRSGNKK